MQRGYSPLEGALLPTPGDITPNAQAQAQAQGVYTWCLSEDFMKPGLTRLPRKNLAVILDATAHILLPAADIMTGPNQYQHACHDGPAIWCSLPENTLQQDPAGSPCFGRAMHIVLRCLLQVSDVHAARRSQAQASVADTEI